MTPGECNLAAHVLAAARLYLNSPPQSPKHWRQVNPNLNDYHFNPMEIGRTFWIIDISDWWRQREETHSKYPNLSDGAWDKFSIKWHGLQVEASIFLGWDVISWRQSKTTPETLYNQVITRQFAPANIGILVGDDLAMDTMNTENDLQMKRQTEKKFAQNGQSQWHFGDEAGQPKPRCYTEGISRSKQADDTCMIHFGYRRDRRSILLTLLTWWCNCI